MATLTQLINAKAIAIAKLAVRATTAAGSGHPTSALSLAHLVATLMYDMTRCAGDRISRVIPAQIAWCSPRAMPCRSSMPPAPTSVSPSFLTAKQNE
jgi:hypothetical protein